MNEQLSLLASQFFFEQVCLSMFDWDVFAHLLYPLKACNYFLTYCIWNLNNVGLSISASEDC
jgi:hypothetical protein